MKNLGFMFDRKLPVTKSLEDGFVSESKWSDYEEVIILLLKEAVKLSNLRIEGAVDSQGLLVGASLKVITTDDDPFKLGMYFDHTTGLPMIKGHSYKGAIMALLNMETDFIMALDQVLELQLGISESDVMDIKNAFKTGDIDCYDAIPISHQGEIFRYWKNSEKNPKRKFLTDVFTPHPEDITMEPSPLFHLRINYRSKFLFPVNIRGRDNLKDSLVKIFTLTLSYIHLGAHRSYGLGKFVNIQLHPDAPVS